jgi:tRNA(Arg) A34 adenosine deaminase TadA
MLELLLFAAKIAMPDSDNDLRGFWVGAVGIRNDGTIVFSKNGAFYSSTTGYYQAIPSAHAEGRVLRKMDFGGTLYVSRVARIDKSLRMARPCGMCQVQIRAKGIKKVYYTINDTQFGVWYPKTDKDRIYGAR